MAGAREIRRGNPYATVECYFTVIKLAACNLFDEAEFRTDIADAAVIHDTNSVECCALLHQKQRVVGIVQDLSGQRLERHALSPCRSFQPTAIETIAGSLPQQG